MLALVTLMLTAELLILALLLALALPILVMTLTTAVADPGADVNGGIVNSVAPGNPDSTTYLEFVAPVGVGTLG